MAITHLFFLVAASSPPPPLFPRVCCPTRMFYSLYLTLMTCQAFYLGNVLPKVVYYLKVFYMKHTPVTLPFRIK